ncbi:fumarylacetoacetate hydrolase family protein [Paraburkholderia sp. LEh10]|uniref:fumarylacetoacetate hydrolase family protein n=1 Tax=Paraburkholderia sp. LEh10 TaxID=2821353 RepID=UPI001AE85107|nr:fumarylacetoacetate hydrolase family protein [Paraburkholderia sp. LEh10]MBP0593280.1 fumarylacetoacetate hydrolase family protein [Paraburkholderia sp. LEh10]
MKLVTFSVHGGFPEIGVVDGTKIVRIQHALPRLASTMIDLIDTWSDACAEVQRVVEKAEHTIALEQVHLLPPIARPGKIMAMGLNYADHVAEAGLEIPKHQVWFCKQPNTVHPPFAPIQIPKTSTSVDYEVELVFVIGKRGRHVSKANAPDHVFGYCVGNDVTARDWQMRTPQWVLGKSFDSHGPFGPWITTADEIGDPHRLGIRSIVNDEVRQNSNTRELIFDVFDQVAYLSQAMTLEPGDIVFSGTPGGIGAAMKPPVFLEAGDRVRCEIDELGAIEAVFENEI